MRRPSAPVTASPRSRALLFLISLVGFSAPAASLPPEDPGVLDARRCPGLVTRRPAGGDRTAGWVREAPRFPRSEARRRLQGRCTGDFGLIRSRLEAARDRQSR